MTIQQCSLWIVVVLCVERRLLAAGACSKESSVLRGLKQKVLDDLVPMMQDLSR